MKKIFLGCMLALFAGLGFAQSPQRNCGTMQYDAQLRITNPGLGSLQDFENWMQTRIAQMQTQQGNQPFAAATRVLPTVVHVIYSNNAENISLAQIQSQIEILNEDFQRLNADTTNTPASFQPVAANCDIEFCLAAIDPNGNPTNGVNRVSRSGSPFSMNDFENTIKAQTVWDPNRYFNIWVANLNGGLLGYAQFPSQSGLSGLGNNGGAANTDGVVLLHTSVGRPPHNPFSGPFNLGRTATHEVGHWLGLRHIWGDGNCNVDDFCNDTPNSDNPNYGCPTTHTSCSSVDMVQNYMDYSNDACMNLFTEDQKTRIDVVMANSPRRASLLTSNACTPFNGVNANFTVDKTSGCTPLTVNFTDISTGNITSWAWNFGDGNNSTIANPSHIYTSPGTYTVSLTVSDGSNNDTETKIDLIVVTNGGVGANLPFTESFESNSFNTNGWTIDNPDNADTWELVTVAGITPGTISSRLPYFSYNAAGQRDGMTSQAFNFSGYSSISMDFDHAHRRYSQNQQDSLIIAVSTDCGSTWSRVFARSENGTGTFATNSTTQNDFTPAIADDWCFSGNIGTSCFTIDLTPYIGNSNVRIRFEGVCDYGNNIYVDNINITGVPINAAPAANFQANATSVCVGSTVSFSDQSTNSPNSWSWTFPGGAPATSTGQNPSVQYNTPGVYNVTLVASNGAGNDTEVKNGFIIVSAPPTVSTTGNDAACGNNNGSATASASGGNGPYSYSWSNGGSAANISNLAPGTYTVTVTDASTCTSTATVSIGNAAAPTVAFNNVSNATCGLNNGAATAAANGGTPGFSYAWSHGATTASISGLSGGSYTVTVTDANGCTAVNSLSIAAFGGPTASANGVSATCGQNNGSASASASGGNANYSYAWSNGGNTSNISGLSPGSYTVTVTDGNGCTDVANVTINAISGPAVSATGNATSCGQNNGGAAASVNGGTPGFTYAWSNGATTSTLSGLAAGNYTVTVTDANGCTDVASYMVMASNSPTASISSVSPAACNQSNGSATATASGGGGNFSYSWSNGATTATISGLAAGAYTVTVTDANGCTDVATAQIANANGPTAATSGTSTTCGQSNGTASASATGGAGNYTYAWSNGASSANLNGLAAGSYTVTVTDANGCLDVSSVTVAASTAPSLTLNASDISCEGSADGSLTANVSNGQSPYTYTWSNGATSSSISGLTPGTYGVTVTDANGCTETGSQTLNAPPALLATGSSTPESTSGAADGTATASPTGGTPGYSYLWSNGQTTQTASGLAAGTYSVTITDGKGCTTTVTVNVSLLTGLPNLNTGSLSIYPNPNQGRFVVDIMLPQAEKLNIQVFSILGKEAAYQDLGSTAGGTYTVDLEGFPQGVYFVVIHGESFREVRKVTVNR